jgi:hypothetical protein
MVTYYLSRAEATAVGRDVTVVTGSQINRAVARGVGFPVQIFGPTPSVADTSDTLRLEIVTDLGVQLSNDFVKRRDLALTVEHNGAGAVSFNTDLSALPNGIDDALLDPLNLVRVHLGDLPNWPYGVMEGVMSAAPPVKGDSGNWTVNVSCTGSWDVLDYGVIWPPAGATGDTREFSYTAGMTGPAFVSEEWHTPVGKLVKESFRWNNRWPAGWPETRSQWIWSTSPEKKSPLGTRQFFSDTFTLTARKNVKFYVAGDETLRLYLNGALIKKKGRGDWHRTSAFTRTLPAGVYTVAAQVANVEGGDNKSGFICAVAQLKADGSRDHWLLRSAPSTFRVKVGDSYFGQVPLPPDGWYPAAVLYQQVQEAAARGVDFAPQIVPTFSQTADSDGSPWTSKGNAEYDIGAQLGENIQSGGVDAAMLPGLRLSTWKNRGFDLRSRVFISRPQNASWSSRSWSRVRTVGLTHYEQGWAETAGRASVAAKYGRREMSISGGGIEDPTLAAYFAAAAMTAAGEPEETIEVTFTSADLNDPNSPTPQPFRDYNVADLINVEMTGGYVGIKVMTIGISESPTKMLTYTTIGYPV